MVWQTMTMHDKNYTFLGISVSGLWEGKRTREEGRGKEKEKGTDISCGASVSSIFFISTLFVFFLWVMRKKQIKE